jgi:DNA-binding NtrC family response regulator
VSELLIIEDEAVFAHQVSRFLGDQGHAVHVATTAEAGLLEARRREPDLVLLDLRLPDRSGLEVLETLRRDDPSLAVVMVSAYGSVGDAVAAMRSGAADYVQKPIDLEEIGLLVGRVLETQRQQRELSYLRQRTRPGPQEWIGEDPRLRSILAQVERLREAGLPPRDRPAILLAGETGAGKGHLAGVIHEILGGGPFFELDCTALSIDALESELFGGAPSGSGGSRPGLLEAAQGGTLLLDEVGELAPALQAKFLGVIERRAVRRLGSSRERPIDVQIMASSHHDLVGAAAKGRFRADLLHRLRGLAFEIPPLRERGDDVVHLARQFCDELARRYQREGVRITPDAEALLRSYPWPGNVRELRHAIERVLLVAPGPVLDGDAFSRVLQPPLPEEVEALVADLPEEGVDLGGVERVLLARALEKSGGNRTRAAQLLGLSRYTFRYRLKKWGLG